MKEAEAAAPVSAPARNFTDVLERHSSAESRRKAERMIAEGDELFRSQKFHSALQKYKLAASTAPDLNEALWRKGHALVATHNYDLASTAFKRAIARTEDLSRGGFRLNDLYGGAKMAKIQDFESLAEWALSRSDSPDAYFLLGVQLNFDGEAERAEKFFQKASELAGFSGGHIAVFLFPAEERSIPSTEEPARPAEAAPVVAITAGTEL
jgi:tetratricopeptide (TPR) repeat protein